MVMLDRRYRWYASLRAVGPVHWIEEMTSWAVVTYDEVRRVLADPATFSSDPAQRGQHGQPVAEPVLGSIITMDPPRHDRLRRLVYHAFLPGEVRHLRQAVEAATTELLGGVVGRGGMDVVADLAFPLPATTIAHLLGVPVSDRDRFFAWTEAVLETQSTGVGGAVDADLLARRTRLRDEMWGYFAQAIDEHRRRPTDDLIGTLVAADDRGERLSAEDLLQFCSLLLFAGHATTMNLIGNAVICCAEHPDQRARVAADLTLVGGLVEETLRYRSPVHRVMRFATRDVDLGGCRIRRGDRVVPYIASANRDPSRFRDPEVFDVSRRPNPHLAFGHGIHFCLGAALARLEAGTALRALFATVPDWELDEPELEEIPGITLHGARRLRLRFRPQAVATVP
jgi:cytochrome P450